ncbi:hypothetical protein BLNAU_4294 [Blattamonas nauphoetae]|uniref:Protein kinase domain-containing protein n=1 Tax=Blattamonas nauphoetae TaxID=2049346 RepID=A0ABQ9YAA1_9EUKA|nr:hypothetical protein BLNAU_4294 [Blattamonas nauphoetae]
MKNEGSESLLMFVPLLFLIFSSNHCFPSLCECGDVQVVVLICNDIVEGLKFMHTHPSGPTAHGDLKPENILLTVDNRAILCDLGAADEERVVTSMSAGEIGTYEYNSPERLNDDKMRGTPESDIWSVGVILHRMVTGRSLFMGSSLPKMIREITDFTETKVASTIPGEIRDVLLRLLDPKPALRVKSSQIVDECLFERILGQKTPLSKMRDTLNQRLTKRIDDITHFRFESENEKSSLASNFLHHLATTPSTVTVFRWTKFEYGPTCTLDQINIPYHPSFLIGDLAEVYHLGEHFLVGRRFLDTNKTLCEEEITPDTKLTAFPEVIGDPIFVEIVGKCIVPIETFYLDHEPLSAIIKQIRPFFFSPSTPYTLETEDHRQLDLNIPWDEQDIKPFSLLILDYCQPYNKCYQIFVRTLNGGTITCEVSAVDTIDLVKKQVEAQINHPADRQRMTESEQQLDLFQKQFLNKPVLWYGYVEEKTESHAIFVMPSIYRDTEPRVLLKLPQGSLDTQDFVDGQWSYFKGRLKGFSNKVYKNPEGSDYSAIIESNTDATYASHPYDLDLTFIQFEEYFGTFYHSPCQLRYEKYWKDTPIDVIGSFIEGFFAYGQFRIYQFIIERPSKPTTFSGKWCDKIGVRVAITQSGDIQRFITENKRLEIVVVPHARDGSPHVFNLIQIVGPRLQAPTTIRGTTRQNNGNGAEGLA